MTLDWKLLREQKALLLTLAEGGFTNEKECELIQGVVNLIDNIQDAAVLSGEATEAEVFDLGD